MFSCGHQNRNRDGGEQSDNQRVAVSLDCRINRYGLTYLNTMTLNGILSCTHSEEYLSILGIFTLLEVLV